MIKVHLCTNLPGQPRFIFDTRHFTSNNHERFAFGTTTARHDTQNGGPLTFNSLKIFLCRRVSYLDFRQLKRDFEAHRTWLWCGNWQVKYNNLLLSPTSLHRRVIDNDGLTPSVCKCPEENLNATAISQVSTESSLHSGLFTLHQICI